MNAFDIAAIVIIAFCLIRGLFKGLIGEISGIIGIVAGFYGAYTYYPMITVHAEKWIQSPGIRNMAAFFILFCIILIIVSLISILIRKFLNLVFPAGLLILPAGAKRFFQLFYRHDVKARYSWRKYSTTYQQIQEEVL